MVVFGDTGASHIVNVFGKEAILLVDKFGGAWIVCLMSFEGGRPEPLLSKQQPLIIKGNDPTHMTNGIETMSKFAKR